MKNKYKNKLLHLIRELDFSPSDFELSTDDEDNFVITYKNNSQLDFIIRESEDEFDKFDSFYTTYSPQYTESEYFPPEEYADFDFVIQNFRDWIENHVKKYSDDQDDDEIDLWAEFKNGNQSFEFEEISFDNQAAFSKDEKRQIGIAINELKFLIQKNIATSQSENKIVEDRLNYLIENVGRLNKFEWKSLLLSTLIGIATTLTLDAEKGQMLFEFLKRVFSSFPKLIQ